MRDSNAFIAAGIANKFLLHEHRPRRTEFVIRRNFLLGCKVIEYPEPEAAVFIDDMARYAVETGGKPLVLRDRGEPRPEHFEGEFQVD